MILAASFPVLETLFRLSDGAKGTSRSPRLSQNLLKCRTRNSLKFKNLLPGVTRSWHSDITNGEGKVHRALIRERLCTRIHNFSWQNFTIPGVCGHQWTPSLGRPHIARLNLCQPA